MLKHSFFGILFLFLSLCITAQKITIKGKVIDQNSKQALSGVIIGYEQFATISDDRGLFKLSLDSSIQFIHFRFIGYKDTTVSIVEGMDLNISMRETSYLLNTSVITSSRFERPLAESSVSMSVIKADLPSKLNSYSVSQVLDKLPGVQIIDGQANLRGGSGFSYGAGSRVLLLMDDLPVLQSDAGVPNWDDLPIENIGQIEVVKGAASALYGSAAMNGIIHFRSGLPVNEPYTSVGLSYKMYLDPSSGNQWWDRNNNSTFPYETFLNFVHRQKHSKMDYSMSAQVYDRLSFNKDVDARTARFHALIRRRFHDRLNLSLGLNFNKGISSNFFYWKDNGLFEGDPSATSRTEKFRFTIDPTLKYESNAGFKHSLLSRYYYISNEADNNQSNKSDNVYLEYQLAKKINVIAVDFITGLVLNQSWTNAKLYSDTSFYHRNFAAYLQAEKKLFERLILSTGIRYEKYDIHGPHMAANKVIDARVSQDTFIFRFGANYRLAKASFFRASFGQGFRFPTIAEKYISTKAGGLDIVPNPSLQAEYGISYELGIKQAFQLNLTKLLLDIALFGSRYHEMMEFLLNNQLQFQSKNIGDTEIKGFEIDLQAKTELGQWTLTTAGAYTYIDPKYLEFDLKGKDLAINERESASRAQQNAANSSSFENILKYRSKHLFKYDFQLDYRQFFIGMNFNYTSHVEAIDWLFELSLFIKGIKEYRQQHKIGFRRYDFRIGYRMGSVSFQINVNNAFNEDYTQRAGLMDAPTNLNFRITYQY